ncbi:MAG: hypothetical protein WC702_01485 [Patescibacteria group bacterium]|jgi:hypothetical protein
MSKFFHFHRTNIESFKTTWQTSKVFRLSFIFSWIVWLVVLAAPFLRLMPTAEGGQYIPLHYNIFFGVDKFGPWYMIFQLPLFGLLVIAINSFFSVRFFGREKALSIFLVVMALLVQLMLLAAMYFVTLLNL